MNIELILRSLKNSGFHIVGRDSNFIYTEDPSCILRSFETFIEYAWIVVSVIAILLLFGWAISMIRGAKNNIFTNLRNLTLMFAILGAVIPIVNLIYGDDIFARGCRTIAIPLSEVNNLLDKRKLSLKKHNPDELYDEFDIYVSENPFSDEENKQPNELPYSEFPVFSSGTPENDVQVIVSPDTNSVFYNSVSNTVIYTRPNGTKYKKVGGTPAWRDNNPGNIEFPGDPGLRKHLGVTGRNGRWAVFPDEQTGMKAIPKLLKTEKYINLTLKGAISKWAPKADHNNTVRYYNSVRAKTGIPLNKTMRELSDAELSSLANAIKSIEGWTPGQIKELN